MDGIRRILLGAVVGMISSSVWAMDGGTDAVRPMPAMGVVVPAGPDGRVPVPATVRGVAWRRMPDAESLAIVAMSPAPPGRWSHAGIIDGDGMVWALGADGVRRMTMAEWRAGAEEWAESDQVRCRRTPARPVACTRWGLDGPGACTCTDYVAQALGMDFPRRSMGHIHPDDIWHDERRVAGRICGCPALYRE